MAQNNFSYFLITGFQPSDIKTKFEIIDLPAATNGNPELF